MRTVQPATGGVRLRRQQTTAWASVPPAQPQLVPAAVADDARLAADTALYEGDAVQQQNAAVISDGASAVRRPDKAR
jgi:hypothetical protein